jgi:acyl-CoA synthetase (AMP-forming)/AMP-acid ligase II
MIDVVRAHARTQGDREAVRVLPDRPHGEAERLTYAELDDAAIGIAAWLQQRLPSGSRVLLPYPTGVEFVTAFFGCLYAGMVPVPAPLPMNRSGSQLTRLRGIIAACGVSLILTNAESVESLQSSGVPTEMAGRADGWKKPELLPDSVAFLQFTSGSTSDPKGVVLTYGSLRANLDFIRDAYGLPDGVVTGSWLPLYHDMGLIGGVLEALLCGGRATLLSPMAFLLDPYRWLEMIDLENVLVSPAPNFAYDLCVRRIPAARAAGLDLSRWKAALNGAEPVRPSTLASFSERFGPSGFRLEAFSPCYGMAEVGLFVTGTPIEQFPVTTTVSASALEQHEFVPDEAGIPLVSSGPVPDHYDVRIAGPSGEALPDGRIGEIWLSGPSVAAGYWDHPPFGEHLHTGDLGAVHDGQLYLTGRLKELIIIRGRNFYPQDLEEAMAELHPAFSEGLCAAFGVSADGVEHLVIVKEIKPDQPEPAALAKQAKAGLADQAGVAIAGVCLVPPGTVRRSTSGKIRRIHMRELFLRNGLNALIEDLDPALRRAYRRDAPA